jgi:hypothetical protein
MDLKLNDLKSTIFVDNAKGKLEVETKISNLIELRKRSAVDRIISRKEIDNLLEELREELKIYVDFEKAI